jgi:ApbE superfamily uncharacterized protein (UPF0280 family)
MLADRPQRCLTLRVRHRSANTIVSAEPGNSVGAAVSDPEGLTPADHPRVRELSGGRLYLSHGPIDVVLRAWGAPDAVAAAYRAAASRFGDILPELCHELPRLKAAIGAGEPPQSPVGRRMAAACRPFADVFVTPMAAVAGSVADELMAIMLGAAALERAYVNDGGDIAVHCAPGTALDIGVAGGFGRGPVPRLNGRVRIRHGDGVGGIATSGARGRSFSLGIADSVSVLAADAATADVAATLIANAVDIDHPVILRRPASALDPDSDLGDRPVTVSVGALPRGAVLEALEAGRRRAADYLARGLIADAALMLQGETASLNAGADVGWVERQRDPTLGGHMLDCVGSSLRSTQPTRMTPGSNAADQGFRRGLGRAARRTPVGP